MSRRAVFMLFLSGSLLITAFMLYLHSSGVIVLSWQHVPVTEIRHTGGFYYQFPLGRTWMSFHEKITPAKLLEDGKELELPVTNHGELQQKGGGRFSFWHDTLCFSSSDNSDPRTNGRKYDIVWPTPVSRKFAIVLYAATLLSVILTTVLSGRVVCGEIKNINPRLSTCDSIRTLIRDRNTFSSFLIYFLAALAATCFGFIAYDFLYRPLQVVTELKSFVLSAVALFISGSAGFYAYRTFRAETKPGIRAYAGGAAFIGLLLFLLLRPEAGITEFAGLTAKLPALLIAVFGGLTLAYFQQEYKFLPSAGTAGGKPGLVLIILLMVIIALLGAGENLIKYWDISGFGDAHGYDRDAHAIATLQTLQSPSESMPFYYYGLALIYFIFGHFFYIQQIVNIIFVAAAVTLFCLTVWNFFENKWAVFLSGLVFAYTNELFIYTHVTQIETWYIPMIILILFMVSVYWRASSMLHLVLLGISIGIAFNCRAQGAFLFAFLCLAPLFIKEMPLKRRIVHVAVIVFVICTMILPWTLRNHFAGRGLTPASGESVQLLLYNDRKVAFYGINLPSVFKVLKEYQKNYPDEKERRKAILQNVIKNTFGDPAWLVKALYWRSLAIYELLPPGVRRGILNPDGPEPTKWKDEWQGFVYSRFSVIFLIAIAVSGLILTPCRLTVFLFLSILSCLAVIFFVASVSARISSPVWPVHILLGACILFKPVAGAGECGGIRLSNMITGKGMRYMFTAFLCMVFFLLMCHYSVGSENIYRPLKERSVLIDRNTTINRNLPSLNRYWEWMQTKNGQPPSFKAGERVRFLFMVKNYLCFHPGQNPYKKDFYFAYNNEKGYIRYTYFAGVTFFGAVADRTIRENDIIEVEGPIVNSDERETDYFDVIPFLLKAEKVEFIRKYNFKLPPETNFAGKENTQDEGPSIFQK